MKICSGNAAIGSARIVIPETVAEGGEEQRRGFAGDPRERQQDAGDDAFRRCFHHDVHDRFPSAIPSASAASRYPLGTSSSTSSVVRMISGIIIKPSASPPAYAEKPLKGRHHQAVDDHAPGDGRHAVQDIGDEAQHPVARAEPYSAR